MEMSRPVHRLNAAAVWWSEHHVAVERLGRARGLASRSSCVSRGTYIRSSTSRSGGSSSRRDGRLVSASDTAEALMSTLVLASSASMTDSCHGIARSSMCDALRAEVADQPLGAVEVAVEDDDALEARGDERVDRGAGATAGAEDDRRLGHLLLADERVERGAEADHVRVVADQPAALAGDRVDGAGGLRLLGQSVDHRHDAFLVRNGDVGTQEVVAAQLVDRSPAARSAARPCGS